MAEPQQPLVLGQRPVVTTKQLVLMGVSLAVLVTLTLIQAEASLIGPGVVLAYWILLMVRPVAAVGRDGIRRPWRRPVLGELGRGEVGGPT